MKIVFMGNPAIANPILNTIHKSSHEVIGVVSNAPKPMGRGRILRHTAVGELAHELKLNFIPVESLIDQGFHDKLRSLYPDIFIIVAFRILPKSVLEIPKIGSVNLHTSLLPKYRGAAPIQHAILNGDKETGITTFLIEPKVDTGAVLLQKRIIIQDDDDCGTLTEKMAKNGTDLVLRTLDQLEKGSFEPIPQNNELATTAPKITREMCQIDWSGPAQNIHNQVRALSPYPGAFSSINGKRLKIFKSKVLYQNNMDTHGYISLLEKTRIAISCGEGQLEILEIQIEGKRRMTMAECLMGMRVKTGDTIGDQ